MKNVASRVINARWIFLCIYLIVTGYFLFAIKNISIEQSLEDIVPPGHKYTKINEKFFEVFGGSNLVAIGMKVKEGDITSFKNLEKVMKITEDMLTLPDVVNYRIVSIASRKMRFMEVYRDPKYPQFPTMANTGYYTMVQTMCRDHDEAKRKKFIEHGIINNPKVYGSFVSKDLKSTVILCDFWGEERYKEIFSGIQKIVAKYKDENTTFHLGGRPIMLGYFNMYLGKMIGMFGIAILVMLCLLFLSFRNIRGMILPIIGGFLTVIWTLGIIGTFKVRMDMMSLTVPFLIFAVAISHSVQIIKRFYERFGAEGDRKQAAAQAMAGLALPAIAAIITDGAGYLSIMIFPFRIVRGMGLSAGMGLLTVFLTCIVFIPLLMSVLPDPSMREVEKEEKVGLLQKLLGYFAALAFQPVGRYIIITVSLILIGVGLWGSSKVVIGDTKPGDPFFWDDSVYNRDEKILNQELTGTNPLYVLFDTHKQFGIENRKLAEYVDLLTTKLKKLPEVKYTSSYVDVLKNINYYWMDMKPEAYAIPPTSKCIGEFLYAFVDSVEPDVTRPYFDSTEEWTNLQVILKDHQADTIHNILTFIQNDADTVGAKMLGKSAKIYVAAGIIPTYASIIDVLKEKSPVNMTQILVFIFLFVSFTFRSWVAGIAILIPLGIGKIVTFGVMGFGNIGYFLYAVPALAPGMGIGVDYSIYVLERLRHELREHGDDPKTAYVNALSTTGKAVIFTAMSVALGVAILFFSQLRFQALMGVILAMVVICNMLAALVLLPTLVAIVKPRFLYRQGKPAEKK